MNGGRWAFGALGALVRSLSWLVAGVPAQEGNSDGFAASQAALAAWLRHGEGLVRSGRGLVEHTLVPTAPQNVERIKQAIAARGGAEGEYRGYVVTERIAAEGHHVLRWVRKGLRERVDNLDPAEYHRNPAGAKARRIRAFDGHILRTLAFPANDRPQGGLWTAETSYWLDTVRTWPFDFLYEFTSTPYSGLVERTTDFEVKAVERGGQRCTQVRFSNPDYPKPTFVLIFDARGRLLERQYIKPPKPGWAPEVYKKDVFSDYRAHKDASGETIWFPHRAEFHHYVGTLPDGSLLETWAEVATVRRIEFNVEIPDEEFAVEFPPGTRIYDGITGLRYLDHYKSVGERVLDETINDQLPLPAAATSDVMSGDRDGDEEEVVPARLVPRELAAEGQSADRGLSPSTVWWAVAAAVLALAAVAGAVLLRVRRRGGRPRAG